jgi:hypothetical protein
MNSVQYRYATARVHTLGNTVQVLVLGYQVQVPVLYRIRNFQLCMPVLGVLLVVLRIFHPTMMKCVIREQALHCNSR